MYEYILFDLDGTLTDPGEGITNSVAYALKKFGIETKDTSCLYKFIGPPLQDSFREYYNFDINAVNQAVAYYREYYNVKGLYENRLYPETRHLLEVLKKNGHKLILATSKPELYAGQILDHFNIKSYFTCICGSNMDGSRTGKAEVIQYAIESAHISDTSRAVMIGDRRHDIEGADANHIDSVGVLYGYGNREELETAKATYIAETIDDILSIIC